MGSADGCCSTHVRIEHGEGVAELIFWRYRVVSEPSACSESNIGRFLQNRSWGMRTPEHRARILSGALIIGWTGENYLLPA